MGRLPERGRGRTGECRLTRRQVLASASWSAVALAAAGLSPLACFSAYLDHGYDDYVDIYADYPDSYVDYPEYGDYVDYADIYCDCRADFWTSNGYCDYVDYPDGC